MSRYAFTLNGRTHHVTVEEHADGPVFIVDGERFEPQAQRQGKGHYRTTLDGDEREFRIEDGLVHEGREVLDLAIRRAKPEVVRAGGGSRRADGKIKPPMPGKVVEVNVREGDAVTEGQVLLVLEAMKMQNDLKSPVAGTVAKVHVVNGANVEQTTVLLEVEAEETA